MSALSLVQMIMRKHGDDISGAVADLQRLGGFPKETAERIATGELPMDEASRVARQYEQIGSEELLHGSTHDIQHWNGHRTNVDNDSGQGVYLTDSTRDVNENYAGTHGGDFKARAVNRAERMEDHHYFDETESPGWDDLVMMAEEELKGANEGVVYPLRILKEANLANYADTVPMAQVGDFYNEAAEDLLTAYPDQTIESLLDPNGDYYDEVMDGAYELMFENQPVADTINDVLHRYEYRGSLGTDIAANAGMGDSYTWKEVRDAIDEEFATGRLWADDGNGNNITSGGLLSEILQELDYDGVVDQYSAQRFPHMRAGEHTVIFPGKEHVIRSEYAAYDPKYRGTNMMGNADPKLLAGTAAATAGGLGLLASDDADAAVAGRLLMEGPQAYAQLRKLVARNKQKGISPGNTVKQWIHDKKNTNYDHMGNYAKKVDGGYGGDYYKQQVDAIVSQLLDGVESPDKDLLAGIEEWSGIRRGRDLGYKPAHLAAAGAAATAAGGANAQEGILAQPTTPQERGFKTWEEVSRDPTAPLPPPTWGETMGKVGHNLGLIVDAPMTGLQGIARGLWGLANGEDLVTAGAQANHMMQGGSQEGFDRVGDQVEGLLKPIDKQFPYLNVSKNAGDTVGLGLGLLSPF